MYLAARIPMKNKMKYIKTLLILTLVVLSGCNNSDDSTSEIVTPEVNFQINQDRETITELEEINFTLASSISNIGIMNVSWFVNGMRQESSYVDMRKLFERPGNYTIRAEVSYQLANAPNPPSKTIEKTIAVSARPSYTVQLKKVEILSNSNDSQFYVPMLGYYMLAKYEIEGIDDHGLAYIAYMSPVNSTNTGGSMHYPIVWDMAAANHTIKVYESGKYYPDNLWYNSRITFYAANRGNGGANPYFLFKTLFVDLNANRFLKPTQIERNVDGVAFRLTLQWN